MCKLCVIIVTESTLTYANWQSNITNHLFTELYGSCIVLCCVVLCWVTYNRSAPTSSLHSEVMTCRNFVIWQSLILSRTYTSLWFTRWQHYNAEGSNDERISVLCISELFGYSLSLSSLCLSSVDCCIVLNLWYIISVLVDLTNCHISYLMCVTCVYWERIVVCNMTVTACNIIISCCLNVTWRDLLYFVLVHLLTGDKAMVKSSPPPSHGVTFLLFARHAFSVIRLLLIDCNRSMSRNFVFLYV